MIEKISQYAKFIAAVVGSIATAGAGFIPEDWGQWVSFGLAILTAIAVYQVPNREVSE